MNKYLERWVYPRENVSMERVYPSGRPPFDPFPVASCVAKGYCSKAIHWHFFWGHNYITKFDFGGPVGEGELFHQIVARFRRSIAEEEIILPQNLQVKTIEAIAVNFLRSFAARKNIDEGSQTYQKMHEYFVSYVRRKMQDLPLLRRHRLQHEVDVHNSRCKLRLGNEERRYPLRARLDEIDLTDIKVTDWTLENPPPPPKLFQTWLEVYALKNLEPRHYSEEWNEFWNKIDKLQVIIETPTGDYPVQDRDEYIKWMVNAYNWIKRIYRAIPNWWNEMIEEAIRTPEECSKMGCPHYFLRDCYRPNRTYPPSRPLLNEELQRDARLLLYDQLWESDLLFYQICELPSEALAEIEKIFQGKIIDAGEDYLVTQIEKPKTKRFHKGNRIVVILEGNFHVGCHASCRIESVSEDADHYILKLALSPGARGLDIRAGYLTFYTNKETEFFEKKPGFLKEAERRKLLSYMRLGTDDVEKYQASRVLRLTDAIYGDLSLETKRELERTLF